jgi:preprotein translocase subunit YajC
MVSEVFPVNQFYPVMQCSYAQANGDAAPSAAGGGTATEGVATTKGPTTSGSAGPFGQYSSLLIIILMFVVFYFLLIRPQQKKAKEHQKMLDAIGRGDEIVTNGGLIGRVFSVKGNVLTLEVADKMKVRVLRAQIAGRFSDFSKGDGDADKDKDKDRKPEAAENRSNDKPDTTVEKE